MVAGRAARGRLRRCWSTASDTEARPAYAHGTPTFNPSIATGIALAGMSLYASIRNRDSNKAGITPERRPEGARRGGAE